MEKFCVLCAKTYPGEIVECPICGRLLQHPEPVTPAAPDPPAAPVKPAEPEKAAKPEKPALAIPPAEKIANLNREQLEAVATKLGIKFRANIGTKTLAAMVLDNMIEA